MEGASRLRAKMDGRDVLFRTGAAIWVEEVVQAKRFDRMVKEIELKVRCGSTTSPDARFDGGARSLHRGGLTGGGVGCIMNPKIRMEVVQQSIGSYSTKHQEVVIAVLRFGLVGAHSIGGRQQESVCRERRGYAQPQ